MFSTGVQARGVFLSECHGSTQAARVAMTACHCEVVDSMPCVGEATLGVQEKVYV